MQQILNNLLSNAIKFTPEGGRIMVAAERDELGDLRLTVADTGIGISAEDQQLVFEKFRQATGGLPDGDAMTREYSGTGLGAVDRPRAMPACWGATCRWKASWARAARSPSGCPGGWKKCRGSIRSCAKTWKS